MFNREEAMRVRLPVGAVVVLSLTFGRPAVSSTFDTCVLQHMQGVTSDVAARQRAANAGDRTSGVRQIAVSCGRLGAIHFRQQ
jgi:hypothetical protein